LVYKFKYKIADSESLKQIHFPDFRCAFAVKLFV